jgi:mono/diheme cytochrome c family protein
MPLPAPTILYVLITVSGVLFLSACRQASAPSAGAELQSAVARGEEVFFATCSVCHETETDEANVGPSLKGLFRKPSQVLADGTHLEHTDDAVRRFILQGNSNMPPMDKALSRQDLEDVLAYLHTL